MPCFDKQLSWPIFRMSMEEPQPVQDQDPPNLQNLPVQNPDPNPNPDLPFTAPSDPPPPQPQPAVPTAPPPPVPPESKKRSLDNYGPIQECSYFKMRAAVKNVRPHFLEMLRTVDFRSCKGAEELQEKLKLLMELYKQMTAEKLSTTTSMTAPNSGENGVGLKPQEQLHDTAEQSRAGEFFAKPSEKQQGEHSQSRDTYCWRIGFWLEFYHLSWQHANLLWKNKGIIPSCSGDFVGYHSPRSHNLLVERKACDYKNIQSLTHEHRTRGCYQ
ncbi:proline-rich protein [Salix suchowensis]|nr:proline-rich protein [Salix suchowensis]